MAEQLEFWSEHAWEAIDDNTPHGVNLALLFVKRVGCVMQYYTAVGHWAQDLSGEEQPPFSGWFYKCDYGYQQFEREPIGWRRMTAQEMDYEDGW